LYIVCEVTGLPPPPIRTLPANILGCASLQTQSLIEFRWDVYLHNDSSIDWADWGKMQDVTTPTTVQNRRLLFDTGSIHWETQIITVRDSFKLTGCIKEGKS
jgi:hypothetical protein